MFPTKILLATDGSAEAAVAEDAAAELANGTGSELCVVHVVSTAPELPYPHTTAKERSEAMLERRRLRGLAVLDARVRRIESELGGTVAASYYKEGKPEKETVVLGEEIEAGLIVVGGKRRPWYERMFSGAGVAERVTRGAGRPVLVAAESQPRREAARR
ncbi:universal stress protein [Rubrobacter marinus]|uniref:Universal stress protein n=1 Tax=Rubrobacter marinus TaxID=2653852 RepID=A0A6G8PWG9_9ACTN|nr:universal stress protein [Rubrobacter marinus]QIN78552.1 universal stress protein [Rubrobacter marinus]